VPNSLLAEVAVVKFRLDCGSVGRWSAYVTTDDRTTERSNAMAIAVVVFRLGVTEWELTVKAGPEDRHT